MGASRPAVEAAASAGLFRENESGTTWPGRKPDTTPPDKSALPGKNSRRRDESPDMRFRKQPSGAPHSK